MSETQNQTTSQNQINSAVKELFLPLHNMYILLTQETNKMLEVLKSFIESEETMLQALGYEVKDKRCFRNKLVDVECVINVAVPDDMFDLAVDKYYFGDFNEYKYKLSLETNYNYANPRIISLKYRMWKP